MGISLCPSQSNIPADLCAPGSLCTPRQTGIFSGVCSHSRKNSQMGITLPSWHGAGLSFIYNSGQREELLSAALLPSSPSTGSGVVTFFWFQHCCAVGFDDRKVCSVVLDVNGGDSDSTCSPKLCVILSPS